MRLNQYIAGASELSRRSADAAIAEGRVKVNGGTPTAGQQIATGDAVTLDDKLLALDTRLLYVAFNKPPKYVTSRKRQGNNPTIYEILPDEYQHLQAVGRLDKDSSGLLLLSNDGQFTLQATHPSFGKEKRYYVETSPAHIAHATARLEAVIELEDGPSQMYEVKRVGRGVEVTLREGRNRQIRRAFAAIGYSVTKLHRLRFGKLLLGDLAIGQTRLVRPEDVL